jgi:hypothetical protein
VLDIAMAGKNGAITKAVDDYAWATLGASRISYIVCNLKDTTKPSPCPTTNSEYQEPNRTLRLGSFFIFSKNTAMQISKQPNCVL